MDLFVWEWVQLTLELGYNRQPHPLHREDLLSTDLGPNVRLQVALPELSPRRSGTLKKRDITANIYSKNTAH